MRSIAILALGSRWLPRLVVGLSRRTTNQRTVSLRSYCTQAFRPVGIELDARLGASRNPGQ